MPLAWHYLLQMALSDEEALSRDRCPPEMVITHALSSIIYSHNFYAKLLALEKGILNFACCANHYIYKYNSCVGAGPSYHAVCDALKKLAAYDLGILQEISWNKLSALVLQLNNVQHYLWPWNFWVGREAMMKIGTATTVFEFQDFSPAAVDLDAKKQCLAEIKWKDLTFEKLLKFIDDDHLDIVCALQWLCVVVNFVPCLSKYQSQIKKLYETVAAKKIIPPQKTCFFPLPTNGNNETITAELLKALIDFAKAMGYTEEEYMHCLLYTGGDGLTFECMLLLKLYLQFHDTPFQHLEWLQPFLKTWHMLWTDLSQIYEAHWDDLSGADPLSIGNSANHIKCKAPGNVKKVDYYPYSELAYQVLDACILDCWR
ncbi:hypothetical protein BDQ12DRAFT_725711 [Crucibulum laeve]|uniref:DUF6589 domain-containing protein n=1 Tax=Crucibulum laeve TaxID=68775 RepID=A0A5C3LVE6_9AGAR|nr:hypothetical protein BDQ12DRAFT_725711 [Crucibulum laeve]